MMVRLLHPHERTTQLKLCVFVHLDVFFCVWIVWAGIAGEEDMLDLASLLQVNSRLGWCPVPALLLFSHRTVKRRLPHICFPAPTRAHILPGHV